MDSSAVLRQQSQKKVHSDFLRLKNEHNKVLAAQKPSKPVSAPHLSKQDHENKDPGSSDTCRKGAVRPAVSRLPVLAKSLPVQTPVDFTQSHHRWEGKPLAGKAKKKKPCTRPVPFNLTQPKSSATNQNIQPKSQPGAQAVQPENNVGNARLRTQNITSKPTKHPAVSNSHVDSTHTSHGKAKEKISHLSGQSEPMSTFKTSATLSNPLSAFHNNALDQNGAASSAQPALSAETCLANMNRLSLKDPTKLSHADQNMQLTTQVKSSTGENFQTDHAAFLSILRNEGVSTAALGCATPQSKQYKYMPQRVSILKSRQKAAATTGLERLGQFSPDTAALQSILQNVGLNAGGLLGATPRKSLCPPGRGTSIYTAQRVQIKKNLTEATGGPSVALKDTPKKWSPQRVRDSRQKPMSAMKWHLSAQQSPYTNTPGLRSCKTNLQPHQEVIPSEIVQRLFDDQEELNPDEDLETQTLPDKALSTKPHREEKGESRRTNNSEDDEDEEEEEEQRVAGVQLFLQEPQRESVIFFSTGKSLLRAPRFEKQEKSSDQDQQVPVPSDQRNVLPLHEESSSVLKPTCQINTCVKSLHRDLITLKSRGLSPAVALLRKRFPPLEELRLDEEVATYTSVSVSAAHGFVPPRPRCGNPLASILHFEESSRFVPIGCDLSSGPSSPHGSPQQER